MIAPIRWPEGYRAAACFTFDADAEAVMLAEDAATAGYPEVMTHQEYGPRVAIPRLLRVLDRAGIRATFFIPGFTAERWPDVCRSVRDAGHEIAHHGYLHESIRGVEPEREERVLHRALEALDATLGVRPTGYRAPGWELNYATPAILARNGFRYGSNHMDSDWPYSLSTSPAAGAPTLVELPVHWSLDDWNRYNYVPPWTRNAIADPRDVLEAWTVELEALVDEGGLFNLTCHPFVSGRPARAAALGELIARAVATDGLWIATCAEIADWVETLELTPVLHEAPLARPVS